MFQIQEYITTPQEAFVEFDSVLQRHLSGSCWAGPQQCDFTFLEFKDPPLTLPGRSSGAGPTMNSNNASPSDRHVKQEGGDEAAKKDAMEVARTLAFLSSNPH